MLSTWHTCVILGLWSMFTDQKVLRLLCRKSAKHIVHLRDFEPWLFLYIAQRFVSEDCKFPIVFPAACHASYAASGLSSPVSPRKQKLSSCKEAPHCEWGWTRLGWVWLSPVTDSSFNWYPYFLDDPLEKSIVFIYFHNFKSSNLTSFDQGGREFDWILAERIAEYRQAEHAERRQAALPNIVATLKFL